MWHNLPPGQYNSNGDRMGQWAQQPKADDDNATPCCHYDVQMVFGGDEPTPMWLLSGQLEEPLQGCKFEYAAAIDMAITALLH
jgi:hypothetical protein